MALSTDGPAGPAGGADLEGDSPLDLTPRTPPPLTRRSRPTRARTVRTVALVALVLGALAFVLVRGLGDATLFFYNVDEAVAQKPKLEERRFRLQGNVVDGTVSRTAAGADFELTYNGVTATVHHQGDLPQLFEPGIPVVLEGAWQGDRFESDRMLVKHSEVYVAEHPDRVDGRIDPEAATTTVAP